MKKVVLTVLVVCTFLGLHAQTGLGQWQDHNSYGTVRVVCAGAERAYAATRMSVFYYEKGSFTTKALTKVTGMSDVGISTMAYDDKTQCLVVAYANSGVDVLRSGSVHHLSDIRRSSIDGDKKIYSICIHGNRAYLACGFGIVVIDLDSYEVVESYYIGQGGDYCLVYDVTFTDSLIVAGTDKGYMYAPAMSSRLHIYETWEHDTLSPMRNMSVRTLESINGHLVAAACTDNPDSMTVFYQIDETLWGNWGTGKLASLRCHNGRILLNRYDRIEVYDGDYMLVDSVVAVPEFGLLANDADIDPDGDLWLGHNWAGLLGVDKASGKVNGHCPSGPSNDDYVYSLTPTKDKLYLCPGGKKPTYESLNIDGNVLTYKDGEWYNLQSDIGGWNYKNVLNVAVDPTDASHLSATAWGTGVLDIKDNQLRMIYDGTNSDNALTVYESGDFRHLRVSGVAYDSEGNLWVTNSLVDNGLVVRYKDGTWESFNTSAIVERKEIDKIIWDSIRGYKWFAGRANRIYVHDGKSKQAYVDPNYGSKLETHAVTCLVQDRSGDIWIGTDKGIKVIYDGYRAFNNGGHGEQSPVTCANILYNEDGFYEYLMAYESISCMAVDGANRKWVGTSNNGLYLISANGQKELHHFTTANSPLASDKIVALTVHPTTGEVYVGTDKGLQSYRSEATAATDEPSEEIHAFPDPVEPDYDGPIAIKGFAQDALVHVTDAAGHTVYSTQALGGQAVWDGRTLDGQRVASGVYYVFGSNKEGGKRVVTKILIIR